MSQTTTNAYLTTKVMSASPEELRLMLLDGSIKFAYQGLEGLKAKDYEASYNGLTQCRNIVLELLNGIRDGDDPELADKVRGVYTFLYAELVEVGIQREPARLEKLIKLLEYERETWVLLMEKLARDKAGTPEAPATDDDQRPSLSLQA